MSDSNVRGEKEVVSYVYLHVQKFGEEDDLGAADELSKGWVKASQFNHEIVGILLEFYMPFD